VIMGRLLRPDGKLLALEPTPMTFRVLQDLLVFPGTSVDLVKIDTEDAEFVILQCMMGILSESSDIVAVLKFSATQLGRADASRSEPIDFMATRHLALSPLDLPLKLAMPLAHVAFGKRGLLQPSTVE
jgi:hypothetical protein